MIPSLPSDSPAMRDSARFSGMRLTVRDLASWQGNPAEAPYDSLQSLMVGTLGGDEVLLTLPGDAFDAPQQNFSLGESPALAPLIASLKAGEPFQRIWPEWLERLAKGELPLTTCQGQSLTLPNGMKAEELLLKAFETVVPVISEPQGGERKEFNGPGNSWRAVYIMPRVPRRAQREKTPEVRQTPEPPVALTGWRGLLQRLRA